MKQAILICTVIISVLISAATAYVVSTISTPANACVVLKSEEASISSCILTELELMAIETEVYVVQGKLALEKNSLFYDQKDKDEIINWCNNEFVQASLEVKTHIRFVYDLHLASVADLITTLNLIIRDPQQIESYKRQLELKAAAMNDIIIKNIVLENNRKLKLDIQQLLIKKFPACLEQFFRRFFDTANTASNVFNYCHTGQVHELHLIKNLRLIFGRYQDDLVALRALLA